MKPGSKVLYLGAASGTSVSHVADIVGPTGAVFAVEFSHRSGRDLINMAVCGTSLNSHMHCQGTLLTSLSDSSHKRYPYRRRCPQAHGLQNAPPNG